MLAKSGIYQIQNTVNGKVYVGSSKCLQRRWTQHRSSLRGNRHRSKHMQRGWNIHGEAAFAFEPLITCAPSMLIWYEQQFIDQLKPEYNNRLLADSNLGHVHDEDTRKRISAGMKKVAADPEWRRKMVERQTGTKRTDATRAQLRENKRRHYENPENREVSRQIQLNRQDLLRYEFNGEIHTITEWSEISGVAQDTIRQRLKAGWSVHKILSRPTQKALIAHAGQSKSLKAWAIEYGLKPETLAQRLKKWDMDKALTAPVRDWSNR